MIRTALASMLLAIVIFVLGRSGLAGVPLEIGRIFLIVFLTLSAVVVAAQVIFGRHPDAL